MKKGRWSGSSSQFSSFVKKRIFVLNVSVICNYFCLYLKDYLFFKKRLSLVFYSLNSRGIACVYYSLGVNSTLFQLLVVKKGECQNSIFRHWFFTRCLESSTRLSKIDKGMLNLLLFVRNARHQHSVFRHLFIFYKMSKERCALVKNRQGNVSTECLNSQLKFLNSFLNLTGF